MNKSIKLANVYSGHADVTADGEVVGWVDRRVGTQWLGRNSWGGTDSRDYVYWDAYACTFDAAGYDQGPLELSTRFPSRASAIEAIANYQGIEVAA